MTSMLVQFLKKNAAESGNKILVILEISSINQIWRLNGGSNDFRVKVRKKDFDLLFKTQLRPQLKTVLAGIIRDN